MIKAIIFDMDGTIIDSQQIVLGSFQHVLSMHGQIYDEKTVKTHVGRLLEHSYASLAPNHDAEKLAQLHRNWQIKNKHLFKGFGGLDTFLSSLKKDNLKIGAFTSATRSRTDIMLQVTGISNYFDAIICGDEVINPKPHKEGVETVTKLLGVDLDEVIFVGDAEHDILSGKNADVTTIGVTHGFGTKKALEDAGADYMADSLGEVREIIESLLPKTSLKK